VKGKSNWGWGWGKIQNVSNRGMNVLKKKRNYSNTGTRELTCGSRKQTEKFLFDWGVDTDAIDYKLNGRKIPAVQRSHLMSGGKNFNPSLVKRERSDAQRRRKKERDLL